MNLVLDKNQKTEAYWSIFTGFHISSEQNNMDVYMGLTKRQDNKRALFDVLPERENIASLIFEFSL